MGWVTLTENFVNSNPTENPNFKEINFYEVIPHGLWGIN